MNYFIHFALFFSFTGKYELTSSNLAPNVWLGW